MEYRSIEYRQAGGIARLAIARPEARNRLTSQVRGEMLDAVRRASETARVLMLTGQGAAFCLGHDFDIEPCRCSAEARRVLLDEYWPVINALSECPIPTLAAVNGAAVGTGVSLALACDIVIAKDRAAFSLPFAELGFVPDAGCMKFLMQRAGTPRAMAAAYLGEPIVGARAADWGMISQSVPAKDFSSEVERRLERLAALPVAVARGIKLIVQEGPLMTGSEYEMLEADIQEICINAPGFRSP